MSLKKYYLFTVISIVCLLSSVKAQDIHFSQFYYSPLFINPAQTGFFREDYRCIGNYRNQWNFLPFPFNTYSASFDMQLMHDIFVINSRLAGGIYLYSDKAGAGNIGSTSAILSAAYHKSFNKGAQNISWGLQGGFSQIGFDPTVLKFGDQIVNNTSSTMESFSSTSVRYLDLNTGFLVNIIPSEIITVYSGFSIMHLNKPAINFTSSSRINILSMRYIFHGGAAIAVTELIDVLPSFIYMHQSGANELNLGAAGRYKLDAKRAIRFGNWYRYFRNSDALIFMTGMDYYSFLFAVSYDINISVFRKVSKGKGAVEATIIYTGLLASTKRSQESGSTKCPKF